MEELLQAVTAESVPTEAYEAIADHLMGLGYAALAARWRSWALLPPEASQRAVAVEDLKRRLASTELGSALAAGPVSGAETDPDVLLQHVQMLLAEGRSREARVLITRLAHMTGLPPGLCHQAGQLAQEAGEPAEAERWFRSGLRQAPTQPLPWFALARVLLDLTAADEALAAAEQGLQLAPRHPWGHKLRLRALAGMGAERTLERLAAAGGLPDGSGATETLEDLAFRRRRRERRHWAGIPPLPLGVRLDLHRRLAARPPLWVVLHGRDAGPLSQAHRADLLPPGLRIQPLASRDPLGLREALADLPLELLAEKPARSLPLLPPLGLAIVHRGSLRALPHQLRSLLERDVPLLAPRGLLSPAAAAIGVPKRTLLRHGGWELLWPEPIATAMGPSP